MAETTTERASPMRALDLFQYQAGMADFIVRTNAGGIGEAESLITPDAGGNSANWVLGHLVSTWDQLLPVLGQEPVLSEERVTRYARGSEPITPGESTPFSALLEAWSESTRRVQAGLAAFPESRLTESVADSPSGNPDETIQTLLCAVMGHQAYHGGQLAILRRVVGMAGAIR